MIPIGNRHDIFGNNVINMLLYDEQLFDAIDEQGFDPLSHKKRREDMRFESYDAQDFNTCLALSYILEKNERSYLENVLGYRMK